MNIKTLLSLIILAFLGKIELCRPERATIAQKELIDQSFGARGKRTGKMVIAAGLNDHKTLIKNLIIHAKNLGIAPALKINNVSELNTELVRLNRSFLYKIQLSPESIVFKVFFNSRTSDSQEIISKLNQLEPMVLTQSNCENIVTANLIMHELLYMLLDCIRLEKQYLDVKRTQSKKNQWLNKNFPGLKSAELVNIESGLVSTIKTHHKKKGQYFLMDVGQVGQFLLAIDKLLEQISQRPSPVVQPKSNPRPSPRPLAGSSARPYVPQGPGQSNLPMPVPVPATKPIAPARPLPARSPAIVYSTPWGSDHKSIIAEFKVGTKNLKICSFNVCAEHAFRDDLKTILWANNNQALDPDKAQISNVLDRLCKTKYDNLQKQLDSLAQNESPDLILCQEIQDGHQGLLIPNDYSLAAFSLSAKSSGTTPGHGLSIYVRNGSGLSLEFITATAKGKALPRHQIAILSLNGKQICLIFNVHLPMLDTEKLVEDIARQNNLPFIVMGDFNLDSSRSAPQNHKDALEELKKRTAGLIENNTGFSCLSQTGKAEFLDHVLCSANTNPSNFRAIGDPESLWSYVYSEFGKLGRKFWLQWPTTEPDRKVMDKFMPPYSRFKTNEQACCQFQSPKGCPNKKFAPSGLPFPFDKAQRCQRALKKPKGKFVNGGLHIKIDLNSTLICDRKFCNNNFGHRGPEHYQRVKNWLQRKNRGRLLPIVPSS